LFRTTSDRASICFEGGIAPFESSSPYDVIIREIRQPEKNSDNRSKHHGSSAGKNEPPLGPARFNAPVQPQ
jgi:hypothetical protein